jgi:hypothetical protein
LNPQHDATGPLDFQLARANRHGIDDLDGKNRLCYLLRGLAPGLPQSPFPSMKRRWSQPFLGAEPHNTLPAGPLTLNHLSPIPLPVRVRGPRHRLILRMPWMNRTQASRLPQPPRLAIY